MLRRLSLQFPSVADVRDQGEMDEQAVAPADVNRELADRLEERERLNVADRATDLGDHDVNVAGLCNQLDPLLDLIGDVRHYLNGRT